MGGFGSGRTGGRPVAEHCRRVDLRWMLRKGMVRPGQNLSGIINWNIGDRPAGSISYEAYMANHDNAWLMLRFRKGEGDDAKDIEQRISLQHTVPHYGGKRWWMLCPVTGKRCSILYLPAFADRFASRTALKAGYRAQRVTKKDKPFDALFKIQRRLGCTEGWELPIRRPKGMWNRTYQRYEQRYWELDEQCTAIMAAMMNRLGKRF